MVRESQYLKDLVKELLWISLGWDGMGELHRRYKGRQCPGTVAQVDVPNTYRTWLWSKNVGRKVEEGLEEPLIDDKNKRNKSNVILSPEPLIIKRKPRLDTEGRLWYETRAGKLLRQRSEGSGPDGKRG